MDLRPKPPAIAALTALLLTALANAQPENFDGLKHLAIDIDAPASSPTGAPLHANITIRNLENTTQKYSCYVYVHASLTKVTTSARSPDLSTTR